MNRAAWLVPFLILCAAAPALAEGPLSPAAYRVELDRLIAATDGLEHRPGDIDAVAHSLPRSWRVAAGGRTFDVSSSRLRADLKALRGRPDAASAVRVCASLRRMRDDLDAYEAAPPDRSRERSRLDAILARAEFADVHGPTLLERLRQQALGFLVDLVGRLLGSSNVPIISRVLIYGLLVLAVLAVGAWVARTLRSPEAPERLVPADTPASAKPWDAWLGEARAAAARGDWPDAVRLAYWAGVSSLESRGMWPADRARTPREYLRLVPRDDDRRPPLASITGTFELVWYGRHDANAETFAGALADLERLGCGSR